MINYEYEELFRQTSIPKQLKVYYGESVLTNEELEYEKFEMTQYLCSQEQLTFGVGASTCVKFSVGYGVDPLEGEEIEITITPYGGTELSLGTFRVASDKPTADKRHRDITAYDKLGTILNTELIDWYNTLFPDANTTKTVKQFRDSLFNYLGITQETVTLPKDNVLLSKTVLTDSLSGQQVLIALCEMNFRIGIVTNEGKFRYVELQEIGDSLYPEEELYPAEDLYPMEGNVETEIGEGGNYISAEYEDYYVAPIDKFQVRTNEVDIGYIEGTGTNAYIIEGNFLLYGKDNTELASIFSGSVDYLSKITFIPARIEAQGNPCIELGDRIRLHTRYATIETYVLQRTLKGIQGLRDTYISESTKERSEQLNSVNHSLLVLNNKTNELTRTVDETRLTMEELDEGLTEVTVTANGLVVEVADIERQLGGETLNFERESGAPTINNYPAYDWTISIPVRDLNDDPVQIGSGLPFLYTTGYNTYADHKRDLCIDLSTGEGYRFLLENGNYIWKAIEDSDWSILYNQISTLSQDVDSIELQVSATELTVQDHETRITENTATLTTQANLISAKVNASDHNGDNSFSWDLKPTGFDIRANNNSVLKVNSGGAEINGKVTAKSGYIGNGSNGFKINSTSITNGKNSLSSNSEGVYIGTNGIALGDSDDDKDFKVTSDGYVYANRGKIGAFELYRLNSDGTVGGLSYKDSSGRWGSIVGGVIPTGRTGKGLLIDGGKLYIGITSALSIYRENHPEESDIFTFGYDQGHTYINSRWMFGNNNHLELVKDTQVNANLVVTGTKNRVVSTADYGKRLLYSLECPSPMFEDIGESQIGGNGTVLIEIESIFKQTISTADYQVFLQAYGRGECFVSERTADYFVVEGTPDLHFGWRLIAKQIDMTDKRLEEFMEGDE